MDKKITITVDEDLYEKFCLARNLSKDTEDCAIDVCMRWYVAKTFAKVSQEYDPKTTVRKMADESSDYYGKAIQRIPVWALKQTQYNHKIIKAYFKALTVTGFATIDEMEHLCSDKNVPELYVPTFKNNYSQMKIDGPKSHGKVFEDNGEIVTIWSEVKETLMKYKSGFYTEADS